MKFEEKVESLAVTYLDGILAPLQSFSHFFCESVKESTSVSHNRKNLPEPNTIPTQEESRRDSLDKHPIVGGYGSHPRCV